MIPPEKVIHFQKMRLLICVSFYEFCSIPVIFFFFFNSFGSIIMHDHKLLPEIIYFNCLTVFQKNQQLYQQLRKQKWKENFILCQSLRVSKSWKVSTLIKEVTCLLFAHTFCLRLYPAVIDIWKDLASLFASFCRDCCNICCKSWRRPYSKS